VNIKGIKNHFINWREWELNPIVIKELRQAVRSWTVTGMLLLFLIVLFITSLGFLVTESFDVNPNMQLGGSMFSSFLVILAGASIFFIPLLLGVRVAQERQENNPDLLYVSTLSPARIIFGKFLCGAYTALLFFSACMPFMAFTNLLRGVDLPTVFFILFFLFLVVCAANMFAIFLACLPMSRPFKFLFLIYGIFQSFAVVGSLVGISFEFMRSGVGAMMSGKDFWIGTATAIGIGMAITGLLFVLSMALVSPPSANRALPVRIYLTTIWLLGGLSSLCWIYHVREVRLIMVWGFCTFVLMLFSLLVVVSNSDQLSQRVRRDIPKTRLKRAFAFFFFNGAAGGLSWVAIISALTFFTTYVVFFLGQTWFPVPIYAGDPRGGNVFTSSATIGAYAFAYALTALFIHRKFMSKRAPKLAGLLAVLLAGGWAIVPSIVLFFLNQLSWKSVEGLQLGNIFNVASLGDDDQRIYHLYFAFGWLLVMIVINAKWFLRQVKNFRPPPAAPPVLE
jgi:hypothetical protein